MTILNQQTSKIYIPKKIVVGYQNRSDTYTGKLAYVIYYDEKNVLRKEASWKSWRDKSIEPSDFENSPTSGFVLNKKAGGYSTGWNHRSTYCRVYDPRGFEFEITIPNLLYILENTNSIKGKGLEGDFVYGWSGSDIILIPVDSPDYKEIIGFSNLVNERKSIQGKDLSIGATYLTNSNTELIYLGRFDAYAVWGDYKYKKGENSGKHYFFSNKDGKSFTYLKSIGKKILNVVNSDCVSNYAEIMENLEHKEFYSPYNPTKDVYLDYTLEEMEKGFSNSMWFRPSKHGYGCYVLWNDKSILHVSLKHVQGYYSIDFDYWSRMFSMGQGDRYYTSVYREKYEKEKELIIFHDKVTEYAPNVIYGIKSLEEFLAIFKFKKLVQYLDNGKEMW